MLKRLIASAVVFGVLLPVNALAKPNFPNQIKQHLGLASEPGCILCHGSDAGGGPVSQPFGQAMLAAGLTASGGDSLTGALDKLAADKTDSDGNGISDIDEIKQGLDPNPDKPPIQYGCGGGRISPPVRLGWSATAAGTLTFLFLSYRSTRRGRTTARAKERTRRMHV